LTSVGYLSASPGSPLRGPGVSELSSNGVKCRGGQRPVKIHPSDLLLEELLFSSGDEKSALQRHLASCSGCQSRLAGLPGDFSKQPHRPRRSGIGSRVPIRFASKASASGESVDYGPALDRSERMYLERMDALQKERADAPALVGELVAAQPEKRNLLVANS